MMTVVRRVEDLQCGIDEVDSSLVKKVKILVYLKPCAILSGFQFHAHGKITLSIEIASHMTVNFVYFFNLIA